jgi:hypothetical protein
LPGAVWHVSCMYIAAQQFVRCNIMLRCNMAGRGWALATRIGASRWGWAAGMGLRGA